MEYIYVFVVDGAEWEAIEKSKKAPTVRLEIFIKSPKGGYRPTYNYYLNGEYISS